jgi:hypothetical protein
MKARQPLGQVLAALADQPRSQFAQNQRNVMLDAVTFVSSFTDPGASQCGHFDGFVDFDIDFVDFDIDGNVFAMRPR